MMSRESKEQRRARLQASVTRGHEAEKLLSSEIIKTAFDGLEGRIYSQMSALRPAQIKDMEILWRELRALASLKKRFASYVRDGRDAQTMLGKLMEKING